MISKLRWFAALDIYSLGTVLLYLGLGDQFFTNYSGPFATAKKAPGGGWTITDDKFKSDKVIKDEIVAAFEKYNPDLLEEAPCVVDIIMCCIQPHVQYRASSAHSVKRTIEIFRPVDGTARPPVSLGVVVKQIESLKKELLLIAEAGSASRRDKKLKVARNQIFCQLVADQVKSLRATVADMRSRLITRYGNRESIVRPLLLSIMSLGQGDSIQALTTTNFWKQGNFGSNGRVLTSLKMAARKGVCINLIILIGKGDKKKPEVESILAFQTAAWKKLQDSSLTGLKFNIRYRELSKVDFVKAYRERTMHVLLQKQGVYTLVAADYQGAIKTVNGKTPSQTTVQMSNLKLSSLRFWHNPTRLDYFKGQFSEKQTKGDFVLAHSP